MANQNIHNLSAEQLEYRRVHREIRNYRRNAQGNWKRAANLSLDVLCENQRLVQMNGKKRGRAYSPLYPSYGQVLRGKP